MTQEVVTADLVDLQVLRRLHESEHASLRIENGPWNTGPVVRGGLEFPHPEMVQGVGHHGVESRQVLGHRRGPVPTTDIRLIPFDLLRRPLQGNQGDLLLDPGLDIGSFGGSAHVLAPHDPRQRPVRPERSELVAVRAADDDQIAPGSMDESPAENLLPQVEPIGSRRREVVLRARVSTESGLEIALAIPQVHDDRVGVPPAPCGKDGSGPRGRLRPQGEPYRILVVAAESKRATVVPVRIEDRDASGPGPPGGDRVARPRFDTTQAGELSGPLTLPRPAVHVRTRLVKDAQLVRASVGDHDPAVGQPRGVKSSVKHVRLFALEDADRNQRLRTDSPRQAGSLGRTGILDDPDSGAVSYLHPGGRHRCPLLSAGGGGQGHQGDGGAALHESAASSLKWTACHHARV